MSEPPSGRPAARRLLDTATLPCGAEVDLLLEQAADGRAASLEAHQRECVHCQAALRELAALWDPVTELAAAPVPAPPGLTASVMSQIRVLARDVWYTLQTTNLGNHPDRRAHRGSPGPRHRPHGPRRPRRPRPQHQQQTRRR